MGPEKCNVAQNYTVYNLNNAHNKINQLIDGTIPVELQYNTDVIFAGKGTNIDKSIAGKIKVNNSVDGYVVNDVFQWDISSGVVAGSVLGGSNLFDTTNSNINGIWSKLNSYSNRLSLKNKLTASALNGNLNIYIDDSVIGWTLGQSFKVAFDTFFVIPVFVSHSKIFVA